MKKALTVLMMLALILGVAGFIGFRLFQRQSANTLLSPDQAASRLTTLIKKVDWSENFVQRRAQIDLGVAQDLKQMLPPIDQFPIANQVATSSQDVSLEIFSSTEKSGTGTDGWLVEVANDFNAQEQRLPNGKAVKVSIRKIDSGVGYDFIASGKYLPDAFAPSSHLWIKMDEASGVKMTPIREKLVSNIAGVVMKTTVADQLRSKYGELNVKNLIDAVVQGNLAMGYTNPFASSTGLNFLFTVLATFAGGQETKMLDPAVASAFEGFQRGVPFVSQTTIQMRDSVQKGGSLDAFVMEYQTYIKTDVLKSGYEFLPFGIRHDNPLYGVGDLSADKLAGLEKFAKFAEQPQYQQKATEYGFNPTLNYTPPFQIPSGATLIQAQQLWKQKKDAGKTISAVFVCDTSGSMAGSRIQALQESLMKGSEFISPNNAIGLVLFNNHVTSVLPIKRFDLNQKAMFHAAVEEMTAGGQTAMYNGIMVALDMLAKDKQQNPNAKQTIFVLTDGETNNGLDFDTVRPVIQSLGIPIYTIGYEANLQVLQDLSSIVEAASMNAGEGDVAYKIGALLNAQM